MLSTNIRRRITCSCDKCWKIVKGDEETIVKEFVLADGLAYCRDHIPSKANDVYAITEELMRFMRSDDFWNTSERIAYLTWKKYVIKLINL